MSVILVFNHGLTQIEVNDAMARRDAIQFLLDRVLKVPQGKLTIASTEKLLDRKKKIGVPGIKVTLKKPHQKCASITM